MEALVAAAATLQLGFRCCDECCKPRVYLLPGDPSVDVLSCMPRRKFYVIKIGAPNSEGIYSHWDSAKPQVHKISCAEHESCNTIDEAMQIWAAHCHRRHTHPRISRAAPSPLIPPPAYVPATPPASPRTVPTTPNRNPATPRRFYRLSGSPRVLINRDDAERQFLSSGATSMLVGTLEDVEDDDEVTLVGSPVFYRVFGSARVQNNRVSAIAELHASQAAGLLVGRTLAEVEDVE